MFIIIYLIPVYCLVLILSEPFVRWLRNITGSPPILRRNCRKTEVTRIRRNWGISKRRRFNFRRKMKFFEIYFSTPLDLSSFRLHRIKMQNQRTITLEIRILDYIKVFDHIFFGKTNFSQHMKLYAEKKCNSFVFCLLPFSMHYLYSFLFNGGQYYQMRG